MADGNPTKIPEMVERVAWTIAIWTRGMSPAQWENAGMERKPYYRAALEVLAAWREPTETMTTVGNEWDCAPQADAVWRAMIAAALGE